MIVPEDPPAGDVETNRSRPAEMEHNGAMAAAYPDQQLEVADTETMSVEYRDAPGDTETISVEKKDDPTKRKADGIEGYDRMEGILERLDELMEDATEEDQDALLDKLSTTFNSPFDSAEIVSAYRNHCLQKKCHNIDDYIRSMQMDEIQKAQFIDNLREDLRQAYSSFKSIGSYGKLKSE